MTIFNLGSINADYFYDVPHLPNPGETLAATGFRKGLGGKGANQSVAAARAGSSVVHIGSVGKDGRWAVERIKEFGVDVANIAIIEVPTGHAIINIDKQAENAIVIFQGANVEQDKERILHALSGAKRGDILLLQNETSLQRFTAAKAVELGMRVFYSAAPFSVEKTRETLPFLSVLALNEIEAEQLCAELETNLEDLPVPNVLVTKGGEGSEWRTHATGGIVKTRAFDISAVDTTGAGDTFAGYLAAGLDQRMEIGEALKLASAAAAIKVTRYGTADAIPCRGEVENFLALRA